MKKLNYFLLIGLFCISGMSCNQNESCDTNSNLNDQCFNLVLEAEQQSNVGQTSHTRERMNFIYQFPPSGPQERVRFVINADDDPQNTIGQGELVRFEVGVTYAGENSSFIFNGDRSAGGIPAQFTLTFSELDRENKRASGTINFSYSNDFGSDSFQSEFSDVEVEGNDF